MAAGMSARSLWRPIPNMLGLKAWQSDRLRVIASTDEGWEHVSVSCQTRCPTWEEMEWVKRCFFEPSDTCMQLHVPEAEHINCHPYCLHIWRPVSGFIPRPPNHLVG